MGQAFGAGSDPTTSAGYVLLFCLATNPEVQRKAQHEIDSLTLGTTLNNTSDGSSDSKLLSIDDLDRLPYVQAIIKEIGRWHTTVPFALPHMTTADDVYNGYFIPAKTMILPNTWAVMHDPDRFSEPESFRPERYLSEDGKKIDTSVLDPASGIFGYGRRICPGRNLANDIISLLTLNLLAYFDVRPPVDEVTGERTTLKFDTPTSLLAIPEPFDCEITPRSPRHKSVLEAM
ncbi:O-methylsterigmatocystin oxidoreductase [Coprinopsis cinerea AmutBmut pab1-1]|nr:O-methylsterigmatocystin oxidoreductase [Coprinopsis cinerea AmutBmut pab1-1]